MVRTTVELILLGDSFTNTSNPPYGVIGVDEQHIVPKPLHDVLTAPSSKIDYILCTGNVDKSQQTYFKQHTKCYLQACGDRDGALFTHKYRESEIQHVCGETAIVISDYYGHQHHASRDRFESASTSSSLSSSSSTSSSLSSRSKSKLKSRLFEWFRRRRWSNPAPMKTELQTSQTGECDRVILTDYQMLNICGYKIGVTHGHDIPLCDNGVRWRPRKNKRHLLDVRRKMEVDILVVGSAQQNIEFDRRHGTVFINAGSVAGNDTVSPISPHIIQHWTRVCLSGNRASWPLHEQPLPICVVSMIMQYGKQRWSNPPTFVSMSIEIDAAERRKQCKIYSNVIDMERNRVRKRCVGHFEDLYK